MSAMTDRNDTDSVEKSKIYVFIYLNQHFFHSFQLLRGKAAECVLQKSFHKGLSFLLQSFPFFSGNQTFEPPILICLEALKVACFLQIVQEMSDGRAADLKKFRQFFWKYVSLL